MKLKHGEMQFELPQDLRARLVDFRQRLWSIKIVEGACIVLSLAGLTYLAVFVFDRLGETSSGIRRLLLTVALFGLFGIWPYIVYRWVWQRRELEQLARLLAGDQPRIGDRLLGAATDVAIAVNPIPARRHAQVNGTKYGVGYRITLNGLLGDGLVGIF